MTPALARLGASAADALLKDIFGLTPVAKATNPLKPAGFDSVVLEVLDALKKTVDPIEGAALKEMVSTLQRQWGGMTAKEQKAAIDDAAEKYLKVSRKTGPAVGPVLQDQGQRIVVETKLAAAKKFNLKIQPSFDTIDEGAVHFAAQSQGNFIRNAQGIRAVKLSQVARDVVADGIKEGLDHHEIGKNLGTALNATDAARSDAYWRLIASVFVARSRTYSTLKSFDEAGISAYQFESVLDERTSNVCRFMHGRIFPVAKALQKFADTEDLEDPEDIKAVQPWPGVGKTADGDMAIYVKQGNERKLVARIDESAFGQKDATGKFSHAMSNDEMSDAGISQPPLHGHCRSTLVPVFGVAPPAHPEPAPAPPHKQGPAPAVAPPVNEPPAALPSNLAELVRPLPIESDFETPGSPEPKPPTITELALAKLDALPNSNEWSKGAYVKPPIPGVPLSVSGSVDPPFKQPHGVAITNALKKEPTLIPVANIVAGTTSAPIVEKFQIQNMIKQRATTAPGIVALKWEGKFYLISSNVGASTQAALNSATVAHLIGEEAIPAHVVDGDWLAVKPKKIKKPKIAVPPPLAPPPPVVVAAPLPKADQHAESETILAKQIGAARGSNKGGMYEGADGVKRYVKFYDDPTQAYSEHLANSIYRDLGVGAPESQTFVGPKGRGYASVIFEGGKTLQEAGLTEERAKKFMKGFVGDVLTGNWDAVGTGLDNAMVLPSGEVLRIDNGGTFLFRAKNGRKPASLLNEITEWDKFFDTGVNPYYSQVAKAAGIKSADDMVAEIRSGVAAVTALRDKHGGWLAYVDKVAPGMKPDDRLAITKMLNSRTQLMEERVRGFDQPKIAPLPAGSAQWSDVKPRKGLTAAALPEHGYLSDTKQMIDDARGKYTMPETGEDISDFRERCHKELDKATEKSQSAIKFFTNTTTNSTAVRASEMAGSPIARSVEITKAFDTVRGQTMTVYRGIALNEQKYVDSTLNHYLTQETWGLGHDGKGATTSTSWATNAAESFGSFTISKSKTRSHAKMSVFYKIRSKTGIGIETISGHPGELEVLFSNKSRFRTTGLSWAAGSDRKVLIVEADEI